MRQILGPLMVVCWVAFSFAQDFSDPFDHWPIDLRIGGKIVVGSGNIESSALETALADSEIEARVALLVDQDLSENEFLQLAKVFRRASDYHVVRRARERNFDEFKTLLPTCQTLLWRSTKPLSRQESEQLLVHRDDLSEFLAGGGTIVFLGPAAGSIAAVYEYDSKGDSSSRAGLGLMPDCLLRLDDNPEVRTQILESLAHHPAIVGIGLAEQTLLKLSGRTVSTFGSGTSTFLLPAAGDRIAARQQTIAERTSRRQSANGYLLDLTQWRRQAIDRQLPAFPAEAPATPCVKHGTLVIVGGGGMPSGLMSEFVDMAGGIEDAKLVYVPCSEKSGPPENLSTVNQWKKLGVTHATFIHTKDRIKANEDDEFLAPLKDATGIWFGGGRQWNFADSYYGTKAQGLMKEVLNRGGVVGGSSAGASIQADFLARATPIENFRILAPGYLRGGLGFISGVAIDQHFSQRGRLKDMTQLIHRYPQMLGIGIDEGTALIVNKSVGTVVGKGDVYFYDRNRPPADDGTDYIKLSAGSTFELAKREVLETIVTE